VNTLHKGGDDDDDDDDDDYYYYYNNNNNRLDVMFSHAWLKSRNSQHAHAKFRPMQTEFTYL
jgi:hypothetical protein